MANPTMDWALPTNVELEYGNPPDVFGGTNLNVHLGAADNTTPPTRFRFDFITS